MCQRTLFRCMQIFGIIAYRPLWFWSTFLASFVLCFGNVTHPLHAHLILDLDLDPSRNCFWLRLKWFFSQPIRSVVLIRLVIFAWFGWIFPANEEELFWVLISVSTHFMWWHRVAANGASPSNGVVITSPAPRNTAKLYSGTIGTVYISRDAGIGVWHVGKVVVYMDHFGINTTQIDDL